METPNTFYNSQIKKYRHELGKSSRKLAWSSFFRLTVFLVTGYLLYMFGSDLRLVVGILIVGIALFVYLVSRHSDLKYDRDKLRALIEINKTELEVLSNRYLGLPTGSEFEDPDHPYSQDIDLFGKGSFFQYLNRTALREGKHQLASLLLSNNITEIELKQEAVKELAYKADWRQQFSALASLVKTQTRTHVILSWISSYKPFMPGIMKWLPWVFSGISGTIIVLFFLDIIGGVELGLWFFVGLIISGFYVKRVNKLSESVSKVQETFHQYYQLLDLIESTSFSSVVLKEKKALISKEKQKASITLKKFSKTIDALDQRNNMIFGIFGNGFLLWDLRQSFKLEQWIQSYSTNVGDWFGVIEFLDAYNSLGNFAFNQPQYVFPLIDKESPYLVDCTQLGHPLLDPMKRVSNDFSIQKESFIIITGANMAGKSTFLRTVSLQILMSNVGLPVCATSCTYAPIKLITSMRTSDSLTDDESYFFSELKRLKYIVDELKTGEYFIILDEILKGTNSADKAIGSRKFVQKLVGFKSTGIIATHDLSLCEIAEELPQVQNYYFDAEIIQDELNFDYRFKKGVCKNMNASFLLKKMEIVD